MLLSQDILKGGGERAGPRNTHMLPNAATFCACSVVGNEGLKAKRVGRAVALRAHFGSQKHCRPMPEAGRCKARRVQACARRNVSSGPVDCGEGEGRAGCFL